MYQLRETAVKAPGAVLPSHSSYRLTANCTGIWGISETCVFTDIQRDRLLSLNLWTNGRSHIPNHAKWNSDVQTANKRYVRKTSQAVTPCIVYDRNIGLACIPAPPLSSRGLLYNSGNSTQWNGPGLLPQRFIHSLFSKAAVVQPEVCLPQPRNEALSTSQQSYSAPWLPLSRPLPQAAPLPETKSSVKVMIAHSCPDPNWTGKQWPQSPS